MRAPKLLLRTAVLLAIKVIRNHPDRAEKHVEEFSIGDRRWAGIASAAQRAPPEDAAVLAI